MVDKAKLIENLLSQVQDLHNALLLEKSKFTDLQDKIQKNGYDKKDAGAIAASIGRKKYGVKKFEAKVKAGRKAAAKK